MLGATPQRDGCPKIINLGSAKTDLFYERKVREAFRSLVGGWCFYEQVHEFGDVFCPI